MNKANECTCPSGDGSLVHPCPAHPAVEQAGGDERAADAKPCATRCPDCGEHDLMPGDLCACGYETDPATGYACSECDGSGEGCVGEVCRECDGSGWFVTPDQASAALAQPYPKSGDYSDQSWINAGCPPEQPEQEEAERPEVFGLERYRVEKTGQGFWPYCVRAGDGTRELFAGHLKQCKRVAAQLATAFEDGKFVAGALRAENAKLSEALDRWPLIRDSLKLRLADALARVAELESKLAELEKQEPVALANRGIHAFWVKWTEAAAGLYGPGIKLYAHPVAQAQHSVPEGVTIERDVAGTIHIKVGDFDFIQLQYQRPYTDNASTWKLAERIASLLAAAPGKEVPQAWLDVQAERRRQVEAEGWTPEHDDLYCAAELPRAAAAYILNGANDEAPAIWPFSAKWWKPRDARSNYVRAGALILAEIERLDRAAPGKEGNDD
ncbi:hypothetical protein AAA554_14010 [Pseudomonas aeruginosa]